jgi:glutathione S-transferase
MQEGGIMKLYVLPPSPRAFKVIALKNHLGLDCETQIVDLGKGDQLTPEYLAINPNRKMPVLEDNGFVLWESNAILFYLASKARSALWPQDARRQADVLRWLAWESAHWDAESVGMVGYEKVSRGVLGLGPADPAFIARGERNFARFAAVLNQSLNGRKWLTGDDLTIADFSIGAWIPVAERLQLPVAEYPEIGQWYSKLAELPAWRTSMVAR